MQGRICSAFISIVKCLEMQEAQVEWPTFSCIHSYLIRVSDGNIASYCTKTACYNTNNNVCSVIMSVCFPCIHFVLWSKYILHFALFFLFHNLDISSYNHNCFMFYVPAHTPTYCTFIPAYIFLCTSLSPFINKKSYNKTAYSPKHTI